jgi:riboflavin kinase/FMN adenylyltransferase
MSVLCLGKFDALHRGHRALAERAAAHGGPVQLLSFAGMAEILGWQPRLPLTAPLDRPRILAEWPGVPGEVALPFGEIREFDAMAFLHFVAHRLGATAVVVGEDFRGGRGRQSDVASFIQAGRAVGVLVLAVAAVVDVHGPVSSTRVRSALANGDLTAVTAFLGRPHRLLGTVVRGDGRGRQIGIPTANLGLRMNQEPGPGVYAAWAFIAGERVPAVVNIGRVPTAGADRPLTVEAHLIGWQKDCYDAPLALECIQRVREERRFPSFADLVTQIRADIGVATGILRG